MRVLEVIAGLGAGGAEAQLVLLATALVRAGCEVEVACLKEPHGAARRTLTGIRVHDLGGRGPLDPRPARRLRALVHRGGWDLVHSHLGRPDVLASWACGASGGRRATPHVVTRHSDFEPWARIPPLWRAYRGALRRAARVLAVSEAVARAVEAWGAPRDRLCVVPGALADPRLLGLAPPRAPPTRVAFVGRCDRVKGLDLYCRTCAHLAAVRPDLELSVAGHGPLARPWARRCASAGIPVRWRGWIADRVALWDEVDLLVAPSRREGLGHAAAEALAAARTVVATDVGGMAELLRGRPDARLVGLARDGATAAALATGVLEMLGANACADRRPAIHLDSGAWAARHVAEFALALAATLPSHDRASSRR